MVHTSLGQRNHPTKSEILALPKKKMRCHHHEIHWQITKAHCPLCDPWDVEDEQVFYCMECDFSAHRECLERYFENPFQCSHILKITSTDHEHGSERCHRCRGKLSSPVARCEPCDISMHLECVVNPLPPTLSEPKHHEHSFTLLSRTVTFTCNACGEGGDRNPYVCLECNLMLHGKCIELLPRVININRHDHRVRHTFHLPQGDWECKVCRKTMDWVYGAFACSRCPSYTVHSKCATRKEVWDKMELEDVPEEEEEIEHPFKVIHETDIVHFSHEHEDHILRLDESFVADNDDMRCSGCVLPINEGPCYKCVECDYSLHQVCASLPRKKRHVVHNHRIALDQGGEMFTCDACGTVSDGFRYACSDGFYCRKFYDVRCGSVSEPFHHDLHPHPLYFTLEGSKTCHACGKGIENDPLNCTVCEDYALCMRCATLPRKVKHRCDDHFLSLCQGGGNASGDLWCDVCETKTDPSLCYYTCVACGLSLHIDCVLGDLYYMKESNNEVCGIQAQLLPNNGVTRPSCDTCKIKHCPSPFVLKFTTIEEDIYHICSVSCWNVLCAALSDALIHGRLRP